MTTSKERYNPQDVFLILKEQHRLCAELSLGIPDMVLTENMPIIDWRDASDLKRWRNLSVYLNESWQIEISENEWKKVFEPQTEKKLIGLCKLIAENSVKKKFKSKKIFGNDCLSAGIFYQIKEGLEKRGINTLNLKPSSKIKPFLTKHPSEILEEITQTGVSVIEQIEVIKRKKTKNTMLEKLNIFDRYHNDLSFSNIETFGELIELLIKKNERA